MAHNSFSVSTPGSLMLMGEHAVLVNKAALVCAVDKRLYLKLIPESSNTVTIIDSKLGTLVQDLESIKISAPFQFVLSAILLFKNRLRTGFRLEIHADFSSVMGLGSSAAVTAATVAVLAEWLDAKRLAPEEIFKLAKQAVLQVQGRGSGADLAASIFGGVLGYQQQPQKFIPLPEIPELTAVYCGYKMPTKEVIAIVEARAKQQPKVYASIFNSMHICVQQAMLAIKDHKWPVLGQLFKQHQELQSALGTSNQDLDTLIAQLNTCPEVLGAKISGSGLGDCVIGLGKLANKVFPADISQEQKGVMQMTITIDQKGLVYEHN
jgi:mevalonate kinase